jgi:hypothetical protein
MKYRRITQKEYEETPGLVWDQKATARVVADSHVIWRVMRDDESVILVGGLYLPSLLTDWPVIWFVPHESLRPVDWRHIVKAFKIMRNLHPQYVAVLNAHNAAAERVALRLGFTPQNEGLYTWQS